jgi:hypothetical protein
MKKISLGLLAIGALWPLAASAATIPELVSQLSVKDQAQDALAQLVAKKAEAIPALSTLAVEGHDVTARGWAIVGLSRIGGKEAEKPLLKITDSSSQPVLVRTWAAAARVEMAPDIDSVLDLLPMVRQFPAVNRPFTLRVTQFAGKGGPKPGQAEHLLAAVSQDYNLQGALAPLILGIGVEPLSQVMIHAKEINVRQMAASYLATYAQQKGEPGAESVAAAVNRIYAFTPGATELPWAGGPLYIPGIPWTKTPATRLVGNLIAWYLFCERKGLTEGKQQISNNLNSLGLGNVVGYQANWGDQGALTWLQIWKNVAGRDAVKQMLADQGVESDPKYQSVIQ